MRKFFFRMLFGSCVFICGGFFSTFTEDASAWDPREPRIEGVSYSEIASWQGNYGGGFYRYAPPPGAACVLPEVTQQPCQPRRLKKRPARK